MSRALKIGLAIGGGFILLVVIALFLISVNQFGPALEAHASAAIGRKVDLGRLRLSILSQSLSAETLTVADDPAFSTSPFLTAKSVKVGVRLWPLMVSRSLDVTGIACGNGRSGFECRWRDKRARHCGSRRPLQREAGWI